MGKFTWNELKIFIDRGRMSVIEAKILGQVADDEPELMGFWVYKKRIRIAPDDVRDDAHERFVQMAVASGVSGQIDKHVMANVCDVIWDRLSDEERQTWLRSI